MKEVIPIPPQVQSMSIQNTIQNPSSTSTIPKPPPPPQANFESHSALALQPFSASGLSPTTKDQHLSPTTKDPHLSTTIKDHHFPNPRTPPPPPPPIPFLSATKLQERQLSTSLTSPVLNQSKLMKFHWRPIKIFGATNTLWNNLPDVHIDQEAVFALFHVKEKEQRKVSETVLHRPKILNVLDPRRSNQVNIAIKNFPAISHIRDVIIDMKDKFISRDGIEKLQTLIPTEDEIQQIKNSHQQNPGIPLGHAEQFLLILASISNLDCRLKLWMFKLDFKAMEKDICDPFKSLMDSVNQIKKSDTFAVLISITLNLGNMLNSSQVKGFQLVRAALCRRFPSKRRRPLFLIFFFSFLFLFSCSCSRRC